MVVEELFDKLDKLQQQHKSEFDKYKNPLIGWITSGWYLSDSIKLFQDVDISWEECGKNDFISNTANKINDFDISTPSVSSFEAGSCSWYQSYHFIPRTKWGVHIRYRSWGILASRFRKNSPSLNGSPIDSVKAALFYLYIHELFHHLIENMTTKLELKYEDPFLYINYLSNIYSRVFNTRECLEESLANSYLFVRSDLCHIEKQYLEQELLSQGAGYNDFINYVGVEFNGGLSQLVSQILTEKYLNSEIINSELHEFTNFLYMPIVPIWIHHIPLRTY